MADPEKGVRTLLDDAKRLGIVKGPAVERLSLYLVGDLGDVSPEDWNIAEQIAKNLDLELVATKPAPREPSL